MVKSSVAGIIDQWGGLRIVVAHPRSFKYHLAPGEKLFVVPNMKVEEPVPYFDWPMIEKATRKHIDWWIATRNDPDDVETGPVKMFRLRNLRAYHRGTVHLPDMVET